MRERINKTVAALSSAYGALLLWHMTTAREWNALALVALLMVAYVFLVNLPAVQRWWFGRHLVKALAETRRRHRAS